MPLPTKRYERFLYRKLRYTYKWQRAKSWKFVWVKSATGVSTRAGVKGWYVEGPKQLPANVSSDSYSAQPFPVGPLTPHYIVSTAGPSNPPHVKITEGWYLSYVATGKHGSYPLVRFHARRKKAIRRLSSKKRSARERQITGANWQFFRNGLFPLWDPLHRTPNDDFPDDVYPTTPTGWPDPLGY